MIRMEAKRAFGQLTSFMDASQDARKKMMDEHKFRAPSKDEINDVITKFR